MKKDRIKGPSQEKYLDVNLFFQAVKYAPLAFSEMQLLLFSVLRRDLVVAAQNFLCAGCGTPVEPSKYGNGPPAYCTATGQGLAEVGRALTMRERPSATSQSESFLTWPCLSTTGTSRVTGLASQTHLLVPSPPGTQLQRHGHPAGPRRWQARS